MSHRSNYHTDSVLKEANPMHNLLEETEALSHYNFWLLTEIMSETNEVLKPVRVIVLELELWPLGLLLEHFRFPSQGWVLFNINSGKNFMKELLLPTVIRTTQLQSPFHCRQTDTSNLEGRRVTVAQNVCIPSVINSELGLINMH